MLGGRDFLDRLALASPVVQAGMGGGVAGGELAGAVSAAGGLGTVGIMAPPIFAAALATASRMAPGRPVAANLLAPFSRQAHVRACIDANVSMVVFHGGFPAAQARRLRQAGVLVFATVGTAAEARRALATGADGLVAQGSEAGGHLVGVEPLDRALPRVLEVAGGSPVLAAGGIADAASVRRVLDAGACAAVAGTRFLLTAESAAHPEYKRRVLSAQRTLRTMLFGFGWPLAHRVIPNAATERWCPAGSEPGWLRVAVGMSGPLGRALPLGALEMVSARQRAALPLFGPGMPLVGMSDDAVDRMALYAGETFHRFSEVISAAQAVADLSP